MTVEPNSGPPEEPSKIAPTALELRVPHPRPVRFRRGVIVGLAGGASMLIFCFAFLALKPASSSPPAAGERDPQLAPERLPESLARAPATYADILRLDAGSSPEDSRHMPLPDTGIPGEADNRSRRSSEDPAARSRQERSRAERSAALHAAVLVPLHSTDAVVPVAPVTAQSATGTEELVAAPTSGDPNAQNHKLALVNGHAGEGAVSPHLLQQPVSPWMLTAGSIISASLITGVNSDLPGEAAAQVTQDVFDSATGRTLLIPQGSRLIGKSDSVVSYGQQRALIVWQRLILPDGSSLQLDNLPASDASGFVGLSDRVDSHSWALIKGIALSTVLGVGSELSFGNSRSELVRALRESVQGNGDRAAEQITSKNLEVQPTIRVRPGARVTVLVAQDLMLRPWAQHSDNM